MEVSVESFQEVMMSPLNENTVSHTLLASILDQSGKTFLSKVQWPPISVDSDLSPLQAKVI